MSYNSKKKRRFNYYLNFLNKKDILAFQFKPIKKKKFNNIIFPRREEFKYTKFDLFKYFRFDNNKKITHTSQFCATVFFIKKTTFTINFLNEWLNIFKKHPQLIIDSFRRDKNFKGFIEHRYDQSIFSLLCKKYKVFSLSAYEFDWSVKGNNRNWQYTFNSPILALRDLKYNFLKRFINRQKKNWRRLISKILK